MTESGVEERSSLKRKREDKDEDSIVRTFKLDLSKYPEWVHRLDDKELVKIFEIGVAVKESITMRITAGEENFEEVLTQVQNSQTALETKIDKKFEELLKPVEACEDRLKELAAKPASKGAIGELVVLSELKFHLPQHTFTDVSKKGRCGDIHVTSPASEQKYLIEVKNYGSTVPTSEIQKFEDDLRENTEFKVGILFSLDSGIARRAINRKFEITYEDEQCQYFIYVPNARKEENLIVWSVMLADELSAIDQGLTDCQIQEVQKLQRKFQENIENSKRCRARLNSLQKVVDDLKEDLMPLLDVIDGAKNDLNKALHQRSKSSRRKAVTSQSQPTLDTFLTSNRDENN